jgi:hypothetical protein
MLEPGGSEMQLQMSDLGWSGWVDVTGGAMRREVCDRQG